MDKMTYDKLADWYIPEESDIELFQPWPHVTETRFSTHLWGTLGNTAVGWDQSTGQLVIMSLGQYGRQLRIIYFHGTIEQIPGVVAMQVLED